MQTSIFIAKIIGLVSVISTLAILVRYKTVLEMEEYIIKNPVITYLSGFFALIIGALLVVSHPIWTWDWRVVITIIGWMVLIKGILRIFFPEAVRKLIEKKRNNHWFLLAEVAVLIISMYLLYQGFFVHGFLKS